MDENRNEKGQFAKGHEPTFTGFKVGQNRGGAPKSLTTQVKDALQLARDAAPQLILEMIKDAQNPLNSVRDRQQCREYLIDRNYGKPNQPLSGSLNLNIWSELVKSAAEQAVEQAEKIVEEAQR